ncbi:MAG: hypothetical protein CL792_02195 [Chloroflexi bacterium]|nr:hypothetical protein [Chloroflexota bacterium]|tara:strand:- start:28854 stop:29210 length:357 start_codon:yes stop_codon:yes gene_type:complete
MVRPSLVKLLEKSHRQLLEAVGNQTESEFHRSLGGEYGDSSLVEVLTVIAWQERGVSIDSFERPMPPQAIHDLVGARWQTLKALESLDDQSANTLVKEIIEREKKLVTHLLHKMRKVK